MVKAKKFVLVSYFEGFPKSSDLQLVEENLPSLQDGGVLVKISVELKKKNIENVLEFLAEAVYLSVDPYMRAYAERLPLGSTFIGGQIAK